MPFNSSRRSKPSKFSAYDKLRNKRSNQSSSERSSSANYGVTSPFYLYGVHPVEEAIKKKYIFKRLYLQKSEAKSENPQSWDEFIKYCQEKKIQFRFVEKSELDKMMREMKREKGLEKDISHQGVVAELKEGTRIIQDLSAFIEQISSTSSGINREEPSHTILITDHITDQQNLGAITRSAFYFGCPLIITESHHSAPIDSTVHKTSSGASLLIPFYQCEKISQAIEVLKRHGYHIIASSLSEKSVPLKQIIKVTNKKIALIMGAEDDGVRPHLLRLADQEICIESRNDFDSLNVSVATGILLYKLSQK